MKRPTVTAGGMAAMAKPRKPRTIRDKATGELELPWSGYRRQLALQAATMTPDQVEESRRLAQLLVTTGLPEGWLEGVEVDVQCELRLEA